MLGQWPASKLAGVVVWCVMLIGPAAGVTASETDREETGTAEEPRYTLEPAEVIGRPWRDPITAPRTPSAALEPSITIVPRSEIASRGAQTLVAALEHVPGAWVETRGRKVKQFFSVRGQTYPYPDFALDGAWQREFHELPYFFATADLDRLEVLRSGAALLASPFGLAGVVDIVPRRPQAHEAAVELQYGSMETYRIHASHGDAGATWAYALGAQQSSTAGPEDRHAAEQMFHLRGSGYWEPTPELALQTHVFVLDGSRELAQAVPPAGARFRNAVQTYDPFRAALVTSSLHYHPDNRTSALVQMSYADRRHTFTDAEPDPPTTAQEEDREITLNVLGARALSAHNTLRLGVLYNNWVAPNGKRFYVGRRCALETYSAIIVNEHRWGAWVGDAGVRFSKTRIDEYGGFNIEGSGAGFGNVEPIMDTWEPGVWSGTLGAAYYLSQTLSFHMNVGSGLVRPRSGTLDTAGEVPADEWRTQLDLGLMAQHSRWGQAQATVFWLDQRDAIGLSGDSRELEGRVLELYVNRDQDQLGLELEARSVPLVGAVTAYANFTAMRSRARSDGSMKRNAEKPRYVGAAGLSGSHTDADLNLFAKYISGYRNSRFVGTPVDLGGFVSLTLTGGYRLAAHGIRLFWEAENMLDGDLITVPGYPDYGRRLALGLRWELR